LGIFPKYRSKVEIAEDERQKDLEQRAYDKAYAEESLRQAAKRGRIAAATGKQKTGIMSSMKKGDAWGTIKGISKHVGPGPGFTNPGKVAFVFPTEEDFWGTKKKKD
jgi:hypothetical protein